MKKALSVTSPDHGMGLTAYLVLAIFGGVGMLSPVKSSSIYQYFPEGMDDVWATTLFISAGGALLSAVSAKRAKRPDDYLRLEMIMSFALFVNLCYLLFIVVPAFGERGAFTIFFSGAFALGALARSLQIWLDRRKVRKARAKPVTESVSVMADPDDESERS